MEFTADVQTVYPTSVEFRPVSSLPDIGVEGRGSRAELHLVADGWRRDEATPALSDAQLILQRALDLVIASVALILLLIPALVIAALVKWTSPGPILFCQHRVGRDGSLFRVCKFRTMADGTHQAIVADEQARRAYIDNDYKLPPDDPRITKLGRFLRSTSLDEIPQLLNVLRGQMSIVGVRPLLADELASRPAYDQFLYKRMRPGMTGLWQVEGRSTIQKTDRLHLDRRYLEMWTVGEDVKLICRTPLALLRLSHAH